MSFDGAARLQAGEKNWVARSQFNEKLPEIRRKKGGWNFKAPLNYASGRTQKKKERVCCSWHARLSFVFLFLLLLLLLFWLCLLFIGRGRGGRSSEQKEDNYARSELLIRPANWGFHRRAARGYDDGLLLRGVLSRQVMFYRKDYFIKFCGRVVLKY